MTLSTKILYASSLLHGYLVTDVHVYLPMDSSKEKMTSIPVLANSWILFPIHLKPGSVSWDGETSNRTNGTGHRQPFNWQKCKNLTNMTQISNIFYVLLRFIFYFFRINATQLKFWFLSLFLPSFNFTKDAGTGLLELTVHL